MKIRLKFLFLGDGKCNETSAQLHQCTLFQKCESGLMSEDAVALK